MNIANKLPSPGTAEWHSFLDNLSTKLERPLTNQEVDQLRKKAIKRYCLPAKGQGKTRARNARTFDGQGRTFAKYMRVSQLPVDWQCR